MKDFALKGLIASGLAIVTIFIADILVQAVGKPVVHSLENLGKKK